MMEEVDQDPRCQECGDEEAELYYTGDDGSCYCADCFEEEFPELEPIGERH